MKKLIVAVAIIFMLAYGVNANAAVVTQAAVGGRIERQEHKYYSVDGAILDFDLQDYIYDTLASYDMEWYYYTFLCQIYQESHFNQYCYTPHADGTTDVGLCQLKDRYHAEMIALAGLGPDADLYSNPYDNLACGMALMHRNWTACWDINTAMSAYFTGSVNAYSSKYVSDVRSWEPTLMEVERWENE